MAPLNCGAIFASSSFLISRPQKLQQWRSNPTPAAAVSGETHSTATDEAAGTSSSSAQLQLDLLEKLISTQNPTEEQQQDHASGPTIREQLSDLVSGLALDGHFSIPLGKKNLKKTTDKYLTVSQRRNIRRQTYLNVVSRRNDSTFFATVGGFILVPPLFILGAAIATGYVQLFP